MLSAQRQYCGKIMLFGEYSVLEGSSCVLIPYNKVGASFAMLDTTSSVSAFESCRKIRSFTKYLHTVMPPAGVKAEMDLNALEQDLDAGLYFKSTIPEKYGLGSSGALCAALYENYGDQGKSQSPAELRPVFSYMESYFHGNSSGMDPLPAYFNREVALVNNEYLFYDNEKSENDIRVFLIDTQIKSDTAPLVLYFKKRMAENRYRNAFAGKYIPEINKAVLQWKDGYLKTDTIMGISEKQIQFFDMMIPESVNGIWEDGLRSGLYALKLCGSGGGGMLLGFTKDLKNTQHTLLEKGFTTAII